MRSPIALLSKSRVLLVSLVAAVALAVVATTVGYAAMNKTVTLSVDGKSEQVTTMAGTVGDVLEAQGVEVGERDVVAPGLDAPVNEGTRIAVRYARPLELTVDGDQREYWVTATDVASALDQIGRRFSGAELSVSRSADISRQGLEMSVVTPKKIRFKDGAKKARTVELPVLTVRDALNELDVKLGKHDRVKPGRKAELEDGDRLVVTQVRVVERERVEPIDFATIERSNSSMYEGNTRVVRSGDEGARRVVYQLRFVNGELAGSKPLRSRVVEKPRNAIVAVGTKEKPEPAPVANYASGSTVWDQLAQCESGGNWAINTGNGYYGGLQFSLSTWRAYGGAGYPHQQSREYQIMIAERVRAATGGYGSWPACSAELGLPQ